MSDVPSVELIPAFAWDCDKCGAGNFVRAVVAEMTAEEIAELKEKFGELEDCEPGQLMLKPDLVDCSSCGTTYQTLEFGEELSDE